MTPLGEMIQREAWEALRDMMRAGEVSSAQLLRRDRLARTPLHYLAAKRSAPASVFGMMLDSLEQPSAGVDIGGNTVLHMAAGCGNADIVRVLLERSVEHSTTNDRGLTPVMLAWKKYVQPSFTLFDAVDSDRFPLLLTELQKRHLRLLTEVNSLAELHSRGCDPLRHVWHTTLALVYAESQPNVPYPLYAPTAFDPLTALIVYGGRRSCQCPTVAVWLALRWYPRNLQAKDAQGRTLLHRASAAPPLPILNVASTSEQCLRLLHAEAALSSVIEQLCAMDAGAAWIVDSAGRLPLHIALATGKPWRDIHALLSAYPESARSVDAITDLPPLLLAATTAKCPLTVVFELLRSRPGTVVRQSSHRKRKTRDKPQPVVGRRKVSVGGYKDSIPRSHC